jgi:hypothetical protein
MGHHSAGCRFPGRAGVRVRAEETIGTDEKHSSGWPLGALLLSTEGRVSSPRTASLARAALQVLDRFVPQLFPSEPSGELAVQQKAVALQAFLRSGRQDLNLRPPGPQPGALPDCATPRGKKRATGIEPALEAWKASVQPQHFARRHVPSYRRSWARQPCGRVRPRPTPRPRRFQWRRSPPSTRRHMVCPCPTGPWPCCPGSRSATICCGTGR